MLYISPAGNSPQQTRQQTNITVKITKPYPPRAQSFSQYTTKTTTSKNAPGRHFVRAFSPVMKQSYASSKAKALSNGPIPWPTNTGRSSSNSPNFFSNSDTKCGYNAFPPGPCATNGKTTKTESPSAPSAPLASKVAFRYPRRCTTFSSSALEPPVPLTYVKN